MKVVQEDMQVGKRTVGRGDLRLVQRMSETPLRKMVQLCDKKAIVERRL